MLVIVVDVLVVEAVVGGLVVLVVEAVAAAAVVVVEEVAVEAAVFVGKVFVDVVVLLVEEVVVVAECSCRICYCLIYLFITYFNIVCYCLTGCVKLLEKRRWAVYKGI